MKPTRRMTTPAKTDRAGWQSVNLAADERRDISSVAMENLTFRPTRRQLRNLALLTLGTAAAAVAILVPAFARHVNVPQRVVDWGIGLGLGSLIAGYCLVMYRLAVTECTPEGIRTRGLGGQRQCRWEDVAEIAIRRSIGSRSTTATVIITTTAGSRFLLGAPVAGGIMPDPDLDRKTRQIRRYWHVATGAADDADSAPVPVVVARLSGGLRAGVVLRGAVAVLLIAAAVAIPFTLRAGLPSLQARLGQGQAGTYTAYAFTCDSSCYWIGRFASSGGSPRGGMATIAPGADITHAGQRVLAVRVGGSGLIYPAGGGIEWIPLACLALVVIVCLSMLLAWIARRGRRRRADQPGMQAAGWRARRRRRVRPGPLAPTWRILAPIVLPAALFLAVIAAGVGVAETVRAVPPSAPSPKALACADYSVWLDANGSSVPPRQDALQLARAVTEARDSRLHADLSQLSTDVQNAIALGAQPAGLVAESSAITDMSAVTRDCFGR